MVSRRAHVKLVGPNGGELRLVDYAGANISIDWTRGHRYRVSRCGVSKGGGKFDIELSPSKKTVIEHLGPAEQYTHLLVMGDSHVGYRHRPASGKRPWARGIDGCEAFENALGCARSAGVDAIIHVGDVFDHHNERVDRNLVVKEIDRTVGSGIPFYYIIGNHDDKAGRKALESSRGIHLSRAQLTNGLEPVNLIGYDHSGLDFPTSAPQDDIDLLLHRNVLVTHETPYPVEDDSGSTLYNKNGDAADISGFIETAEYGIDLVLNGHLHLARQGTVRGCNIPVLVTGPTMPISKAKRDNEPSTWLVSISSETIRIDRQPL